MCFIWRLGSGKPSNVIVDGGRDSEEEEDETFMVEETAAPQEPEQVRELSSLVHLL